MNHQAGVSKFENKNRAQPYLFWDLFASFVFQIGEFIHLDVACCMKPHKLRKRDPCRRLVRRRDPPVPRDTAVGTTASQGSTAPRTGHTARGVLIITKFVAHSVVHPYLPSKLTSTDHVASSCRVLIAAIPSLLRLGSLGAATAHPRYPIAVAS